MPVERDRYRAIAGAFATGVAIVTTVDAQGSPKGLTTQSFVGVSTEPPLILVSIDKTSRTLASLRHTRAFVVNFLKFDRADLATLFASKEEEKFRDLVYEQSAAALGAPIFRDACVAFAECVVVEEIEAGDHWIFVSRVDGGNVLGGIPLLYYRRSYAAWPDTTPHQLPANR